MDSSNDRELDPLKSRDLAYWVSTALIAFVLGGGGIADIMQIPAVVQGMTQLGYPKYFCTIIGIWKLLGVVALLMPGQPRLKEWAYAGTVFDLTGAAASHFAIGDQAIKGVLPLIFTAIAFVSWGTRPPSRSL